jgi:hypothetical protein
VSELLPGRVAALCKLKVIRVKLLKELLLVKDKFREPVLSITVKLVLKRRKPVVKNRQAFSVI